MTDRKVFAIPCVELVHMQSLARWKRSTVMMRSFRQLAYCGQKSLPNMKIGELPKLCVKIRPDSWLVCGPFRRLQRNGPQTNQLSGRIFTHNLGNSPIVRQLMVTSRNVKWRLYSSNRVLSKVLGRVLEKRYRAGVVSVATAVQSSSITRRVSRATVAKVIVHRAIESVEMRVPKHFV